MNAALLALACLFPAQAPDAANRIQVQETEEYIQIDTSALQAKIRKKGYVSGIAAGSFLDKKTGSRDLGFGLHIMDFFLPLAGEMTIMAVTRSCTGRVSKRKYPVNLNCGSMIQRSITLKARRFARRRRSSNPKSPAATASSPYACNSASQKGTTASSPARSGSRRLSFFRRALCDLRRIDHQRQRRG